MADEAEDNAVPKDDEESAASNADNNMVRWRGNLVPKEEAKALRHVFDELKDHFGHNMPDPKMRVNVVSLAHPGNGPVWRGDLDFTYEIEEDEHCNLAFVSMDVCVDLIPKRIQKEGELMLKDYGKTWVYTYLQQETYDKFKQYVKIGTGWNVSPEGTVEDLNRSLVAVEARLHHQDGQPPPSFWVLKNKEAASIADMSFSRIGSIQEVNDTSGQQRVHRGIGIFSVSMEVEGTPNFQPTPGVREEANLCFTLVSVRSWGITDCVAPIVYSPSKCL